MSFKKALGNAGIAAGLFGLVGGGFIALIAVALGIRALLAAIFALPVMFAWNFIAPHDMQMTYVGMWAAVFLISFVGSLFGGRK